jgi:hypothetical protein
LYQAVAAQCRRLCAVEATPQARGWSFSCDEKVTRLQDHQSPLRIGSRASAFEVWSLRGALLNADKSHPAGEVRLRASS